MLTAIYERLDRCSSLPTLPSVAVRILELCQQDQLDLTEIAQVIGRDPALATKLLRTANSPMFALRREATSILHAVNLLGVSAVRTMVLSFSLAQECGTGGKAGLATYWRRSLLSAVAARELRNQGPVKAEEAFLAALLQDIGMLALSRTLGREYDKLMAESKGDHDRLVELERKAYGADHAAVGEWLLGRWRVPSTLASVVGASHDPSLLDGRGDPETRRLATVVAVAARFADLFCLNAQKGAERLHQELARQPDLNVDVSAVQSVLLDQAPSLAPMFDVHLEPSEMAAILEQAQEIQVALSMRAALEVQSIHESLARLESRTAALLVEAQRDPLTGVANRGYTDNYLQDLFPAARSSGRRIGIIFADIDRFKTINDTHGHAAGDSVLRSVAQEIGRSVRAGDFVGRYGGEEFVVIVRAEAIQEVMTVAERIRSNISERPLAGGIGIALSVTASLGCALLDTMRHREPADLMADADRALYRAKREGRNRVSASVNEQPELSRT